MNLKQMRERLGQIANKLGEFKNVENFTPEQITEVNDLNDEFNNLKNQIETLEKIENVTNLNVDPVTNTNSTSTRQVSASASIPAATNRTSSRGDMKKGGFESAGNFFAAVKKAANGDHHPNFQNNEAFEKNGEDGGFLVPEDFRSEIQRKVEGDESLLARTRQFKTSSNHLVLPTNETAPWDGNGIQAFWEGEGNTYQKSKAKFGSKTWRLHKLTVLVPVSEELLEDAPALESWVNMMAPEAIMHKVNSAIINGDGAGKPEGILNSGFTIDVEKESGQLADTIVYQNVIKMEARLVGQGVWIAHAQVKEQLRQLKDDNGNLIYMNGGQFPNMSAQPFDLLLGKPVIYMMGAMQALGDRGDLLLVNFNYYISAVKSSGVKQQVSTHVYFDRDLTAFKFSFRVAGQCPYREPITTENGGYEMSGFVALEDRA